jgi:hypothetical protein
MPSVIQHIAYSRKAAVLLAIALVSSACQMSSARAVSDGGSEQEPALAAPHDDGGATPLKASERRVDARAAEAKPAMLAQAPEMKWLYTFVQGSPYVAVVQHLSVSVSRTKKSEDTHRYKARVLETIRGPKLSEISYVMSTEPGETAGVDKKQVIITLCRDQGGYYWPGVGSDFPSTPETLAVAREAAKLAPQGQQTFSNCQ